MFDTELDLANLPANDDFARSLGALGLERFASFAYADDTRSSNSKQLGAY